GPEALGQGGVDVDGPLQQCIRGAGTIGDPGPVRWQPLAPAEQREEDLQSVRKIRYPRHLATSRFGRIRGTILSRLEQIARPPPPARRHPGNREQPCDFLAITGVDAKYVSDGEIMIGPLDYPDLISGRHIPFDDYSEVSPGAQRLGEVARKQLIVHPDSKPPARNSRLGKFKYKGSDLPALSDERIVHLNPFRREVLAKLAVCKRSADLLLPPPCVFNRVGVDHLVGPPVSLAIGLVVSGKIHSPDGDPTDDR